MFLILKSLSSKINKKNNSFLSFLPAFCLILISLFLGISQIELPKNFKSTEGNSNFSTERVMLDLEKIANKPHPIGSNEHSIVKNQIIKTVKSLGYHPVIQKTTAIDQTFENVVYSGEIENIIVNLKGKGDKNAILVTAHYDSVPTSPGAADDGSGVATMIEILRVLKNNPILENDVIFLFSDGEEAGLLGAEAFMKESPLSHNVELVINLEARGNTGPSLMFETGDGNQNLIKGLSKANQPLASSLFYSLYKILPNNTDFTVYKRFGLSGMNFAFGEGVDAYHNSQDTINNIDSKSIEQQGSNTLDLVKYFGNEDISNIKSTDAVYFNLTKKQLIYYSYDFVFTLCIFINLLLLIVIIVAIKKKLITLPKLILASLISLLSLIISGVLATLLWEIIVFFMRNYEWIIVNNRNFSLYYLICISLVCLSLYLIFSKYLCDSFGIYTFSLSTFLIWDIIMLATSIWLPGGSYLFAWPLLFSIMGVFFILSNTWWRRLTNTLFLLPCFILFPPIIYLLFAFLTIDNIGVLIFIMLLVLSLFVPYLYKWELLKYSRVYLVLLIISLLFIPLLNTYLISDKEQINKNYIMYILNSDRKEAIWTSKINSDLRNDFQKGNVSKYSLLVKESLFYRKAKVDNINPPKAEVIFDSSKNGIRTIQLDISSTRKAQYINIINNSNTKLYSVKLNSKSVHQFPENLNVVYGGVQNKNLKLELKFKANEKLSLVINDSSYDLPNRNVLRLQDNWIYMNETVVQKTYNF